MSCATRAPNTTASSSELEASRFAPCAPVEATSPQAHSPSTLVRPEASVRMPAHVIMRRRRDRDRLLCRIDARALARGIDGGEGIPSSSAPEAAAIEKGAASAHDLAINPRATTSRGSKLGVGVERAHEALATRVDQGRAFAPERFGGERARGRARYRWRWDETARIRRRQSPPPPARPCRCLRRAPRVDWW